MTRGIGTLGVDVESVFTPFSGALRSFERLFMSDLIDRLSVVRNDSGDWVV